MPLSSEVRAVCGSAASTELRGGRLARAVPTANDAPRGSRMRGGVSPAIGPRRLARCVAEWKSRLMTSDHAILFCLSKVGASPSAFARSYPIQVLDRAMSRVMQVGGRSSQRGGGLRSAGSSSS